jgi:hypothetical protein
MPRRVRTVLWQLTITTLDKCLFSCRICCANWLSLFSINVRLTCMCYPFRQGTLGTGRVVKLMDIEPKLWQESLCLIIPTISTKRTITSYHNSLNTKWGTTTNDVRNIGFALGQAQYYIGVKPVIENICEKLTWWPHLTKDWSQFFFGSWRNNLNQVVHTV